MALSSYRMCDARKTFRLGEAADLWGGTDEQFATPTPHVIVPNPPAGEDKPAFSNFVQPEENPDATFGGVFASDKSWLFTKEPAPSGYAVLQILKEAADSGELPVLGSPPYDRMTRVRREDLKAFAKRMLAGHDWPLPWFLFPGERPPPKNRSNSGGKNDAWRAFKKLRRAGPMEAGKTKADYITEAMDKFGINTTNARDAWTEAARNVPNEDWARAGPKVKQ